MKALIFSDTHRATAGVYEALEAHPDTNLVIHAGDVQSDAEEIDRRLTRTPFVYVLGNNDWLVRDVPYDRFFEFGGKKIFLTHGHNYGVKMSPHRVMLKAMELGADICIFGHTHRAMIDQGEILLINPGSARNSYAVLTIEGDEIKAEIKKQGL